MDIKKSPFAPVQLPVIPAIRGVRMAVAAAGVKYRNRPDVFLAELCPGTATAGVLTRSLTRSASIDWCAEVLKAGRPRAIIVNSGNANAFTGKAGVDANQRVATAAAQAIGCQAKDVLVAATGVIGEPLPADKIEAVMADAEKNLSGDGWAEAARAIMTTDTFPKLATKSCEIAGTPITLAGIAKGSGMIAPDMATMLAFVFCDAAIPASILKKLLASGADRSFNCISVDSDTSTSDILTLSATGQAENALPHGENDPILGSFKKALDEILEDMAIQIVKDGEGISKFITIDVDGAENDVAARRIGLAIANSPLVKTAIAGEDANWGRIVMAIGKSGERADRDKLTIAMRGIAIAEKGERVENYDETLIHTHMRGGEIHIGVHVGIHNGKARVWGCDLTHDYIAINADYRS